MHSTMRLTQMTVLLGVMTLTLTSDLNGLGDLDKAEYFKMAREIADEYMEKKSSGCPMMARGRPKTAGVSKKRLTSSEKMRAYHAPTLLTSRRRKLAQQKTTRFEALALLVGNGNKELVRELAGDNVFQRAIEDPFCDIELDCTDNANLILVDGHEFRTANGSCNNIDNPLTGATGIQHVRLLDQQYRNDIWAKVSKSNLPEKGTKDDLPHPRDISNIVFRYNDSSGDEAASSPVPSLTYVAPTTLFMTWGQFMSHDIIQTPEGDVGNNVDDCCDTTQSSMFCDPITISADDPYYNTTGQTCMDVRRSDTVFAECGNTSSFQNQYNAVTVWIDASNVYGSSEEEMDELRTFVGGQLKVANDFMPEDTTGDAIHCDEDGTDGGYCFLCGDSRCNVVPSLTALHTIFVREHNRLAEAFSKIRSWDDERIFQEVRKIVGAYMQIITYEEWLKVLMSDTELSDHSISNDYSYNSSIDASFTQAAAIALRLHDMVPNMMHIANSALEAVYANDTADLYLKPSTLLRDNYQGIDQLSRGIASDESAERDGLIDQSMRNLLMTDAQTAFDIVVLNINRHREWGMPPFSDFGILYDIEFGTDGSDLTDWNYLNTTHSTSAIELLSKIYTTPLDVDLWVGLNTEEKLTDTLLGAVSSAILGQQFSNLKHGDRFWYTRTFDTEQRAEIEKATLGKILCDNLNDVTILPSNVFELDSSRSTVSCDEFESLDLSVWPTD